MKISIITAVYNQGCHIRDAVESVLAQDYPDIEYIVVDGVSTDGTLDILKEYEGRIDKLVSEKDNGLYDALNKGIRMATGDYVGFLHSDDLFYDKHVISRVVAEIKRRDCDIFYADGIFTPSTNPYVVLRDWVSGSYSRTKVKMGWLPLHPTTYIRRSTYLAKGLYDPTYQIAGDTELLMRYLLDKNLKVTYMHNYVVRMRLGGMSTTVWSTRDKWIEDLRAYRSNGLSPFALVGKRVSKLPQVLLNKSFYGYMLRKTIKKLKG